MGWGDDNVSKNRKRSDFIEVSSNREAGKFVQAVRIPEKGSDSDDNDEKLE